MFNRSRTNRWNDYRIRALGFVRMKQYVKNCRNTNVHHYQHFKHKRIRWIIIIISRGSRYVRWFLLLSRDTSHIVTVKRLRKKWFLFKCCATIAAAALPSAETCFRNLSLFWNETHHFSATCSMHNVKIQLCSYDTHTHTHFVEAISGYLFSFTSRPRECFDSRL